MSTNLTNQESASDDESSRHQGESVSESESEDGHPLLDTMADEGDESEAQSEDDHDLDNVDDTFHQFSRLPLELRHRIWEVFCPALTDSSCMFEFELARLPVEVHELADPNVRQSWLLQDGITLPDHTREIRTVLAVNHEARDFALKRFPHTLDLNSGPTGDAVVPFHNERDIILLSGNVHFITPRDSFLLTNMPEQVKGITIPWEDSGVHDAEGLANLVNHFTNLKALFLCRNSDSCKRSLLRWCKSDLVIRDFIDTFERVPGLGEDLEFIYCRPDHQNHPDFAKYQIPQELIGEIPWPLDIILERKAIQAWPAVLFELDSGIRRFRSLPEYDHAQPAQDDDSDDSDSEELDDEDERDELDEYESEGIDDEPIEEEDEDEDDEISIDEDDVGADGQSDNEAQFSSPEPDPINRTRKRRVVDDSDEDDDDAPEPTAKRIRTARVIPSDSEDEGQEPRPQKSVPGQQSESSEDDGSEDEEDESEAEDEESSRPLSLAERLRTHRQENPISSEDEGEEDEDETDVNDDDEDDDEDEDEEEVEDDSLANPMFEEMAEEQESDDEDEQEEYPEYDAF